jgi:hypothetical protein
METKSLLVELFTIPQAACNSGKENWKRVAVMIRNLLEIKFGSAIGFKHIEFMSEQGFEHQKEQKILENSVVNFPIVLVDGGIRCADKKINVSKVQRAILLKLR